MILVNFKSAYLEFECLALFDLQLPFVIGRISDRTYVRFAFLSAFKLALSATSVLIIVID